MKVITPLFALFLALAGSALAFDKPTDLWAFNHCLGSPTYIARFGSRVPYDPPRRGDLLEQNPFSVGGACSAPTNIGFCSATDNSGACKSKIEDVVNAVSGGSEYTLVRAGMYQSDGHGLSVRHGFRSGKNRYYKACSRPFESVFGMETIRETRNSRGQRVLFWHLYVSCLSEGRTVHFTASRLNDFLSPSSTNFLGMPGDKLKRSIKACDRAYRSCGDLDVHNYQDASGMARSRYVFHDAAVESRRCSPSQPLPGTFHFYSLRAQIGPQYEQICKGARHMMSFIFNLKPQ